MQPPNDLTVDLTALAQLPLETLRTRWAETFGGPASQSARSDYLVRVLAFHIQASAGGGVSRSLTKRLAKLEVSQAERGAKPNNIRTLQPGTRLLRDWKGTTHEVEVVVGGFRHLGTTYASLSEVSRGITGTRWSGPLFFGLRSGGNAVAKNDSVATYTVDLSSKARTNVDGAPGVR